MFTNSRIRLTKKSPLRDWGSLCGHNIRSSTTRRDDGPYMADTILDDENVDFLLDLPDLETVWVGILQKTVGGSIKLPSVSRSYRSRQLS